MRIIIGKSKFLPFSQINAKDKVEKCGLEQIVMCAMHTVSIECVTLLYVCVHCVLFLCGTLCALCMCCVLHCVHYSPQSQSEIFPTPPCSEIYSQMTQTFSSPPMMQLINSSDEGRTFFYFWNFFGSVWFSMQLIWWHAGRLTHQRKVERKQRWIAKPYFSTCHAPA